MVSTTLHNTSTPHHQQATARPASPLLASPFRRKTMSITQTYYLAHKARAKLSSEAQRPDHNLRKLVGSANLLDALMLELADAEREQESWFNQSVRGARTTPKNTTTERRVQWADSVVEEPEDDWEADDVPSDESDEESDLDTDEDVDMADIVSLTRVSSAVNKTAASMTAQEPECLDDDDEEDYEHLSLTRSPSHSASLPPPPDLDEDDSDMSEDDSMPSSPETAALPSFSEKEAKQQQDTPSPPTSPTEQGFYSSEGYYISPRSSAGLVSAILVY